EADDAAVVVAALRLPCVLLDGPQPDDVPVERQRRAVPNEAVHPVAQQRGGAGNVGVRAGGALRPVEVNVLRSPGPVVEESGEQGGGGGGGGWEGGGGGWGGTRR